MKFIAKFSYIFIFFFTLFYFSSFAEYNEVFDETGKIRPQYFQMHEYLSGLPKKEIERRGKLIFKEFKQEFKVLPYPRLLEEKEFNDVLKKGVAQRGRALYLFLKDHYSGNKEYAKNNVIPESVIKQILNRSGEDLFENVITPEHLTFWYGPDIIRDAEGKFRIIEDNTGFIGGPGDITHIRQYFLKHFPEMKKFVKNDDPESFFREMLENYRKRMDNPKDAIVLLRYANPYLDDFEDVRTEEILKKYGVITVKRYPFNKKTSDRLKKLKVTNDQVVIEYKDGNGKMVTQKVGFIINNLTPADIDPSHPSFYKIVLKSEAEYAIEHPDLLPVHKENIKKLLYPDVNGKINYQELENYLLNKTNIKSYLEAGKQFNPGLMDAIIKQKVKTNYVPGIEFVNDKEFYVYVEDIIRFYLKEEPIIKNLPTMSFRTIDNFGKIKINETLFDLIKMHPEDFVLKKVDGRGGAEVWIGAKLPKSDIMNLLDEIKKSPENYIAQKFTQISTLYDHLVDLRVIADITPEKIVMAPVPFGRASPITGSGKVNISSSGSETVVFIVKTEDCLRAFERKLQ